MRTKSYDVYDCGKLCLICNKLLRLTLLENSGLVCKDLWPQQLELWT
jgi:hypothetical protein